MEEVSIVPSRHKEARSLLRNSFQNKMFSLVPFEIWMMIVAFTDPKVIGILSQTCWGFREIVTLVLGLVDVFDVALILRQEGQVSYARKCLLRCATNGNLLAMFHLGYAYFSGGWGIKRDLGRAYEWFKKAAESEYAPGVALYSSCLARGYGIGSDYDLSNIWGRKALESNNPFASGYCSFIGLGTEVNKATAFAFFETSAKENDEFGQFMLGECYFFGRGTQANEEKALFWFSKSASQGFANAQYKVGCVFRDKKKPDKENAKIWFKKAANQAQESAINELLNT